MFFECHKKFVLWLEGEPNAVKKVPKFCNIFIVKEFKTKLNPDKMIYEKSFSFRNSGVPCKVSAKIARLKKKCNNISVKANS